MRDLYLARETKNGSLRFGGDINGLRQCHKGAAPIGVRLLISFGVFF